MLHIFRFQVERGMSWEAAEQKKEEGAQDENEGYWLSMQVLLNRRCFFYCKNVRRLTIQVRNGKKTAILALMDETSKKGKNKKPDSKLFYVYRSTILKKPRILVDLPLI